MRYISRELESEILKAVKNFAGVVLTGPRRAGKTRLLRRLFPNADYYLLEDPDLLMRVKADPRGFLDAVKLPVILDEVQNVPEIFSYVRARIDHHPNRRGQWILTGSQEAPLMHGVSESMAGRAAVLQLLPLSYRETDKVSILHGGYPEAIARPTGAQMWFGSYVQTYLERDVRAITAVKDLSTFRRFLALLAARHGQVLNRTDLAAPVGVSVPTISQWLNILEMTAQILIVPPYFENLGKRLVKSPKIYIADAGLAAYLLGIQSQQELAKSPFYGALFEGFIASEILKAQVNRGRRRELYYFRDEQGLEVDFVVPLKGGTVLLAECRSTRTPTPAMTVSMQRLAGAMKEKKRESVNMTLIYMPAKQELVSRAISPGVSLQSWKEFVAGL